MKKKKLISELEKLIKSNQEEKVVLTLSDIENIEKIDQILTEGKPLSYLGSPEIKKLRETICKMHKHILSDDCKYTYVGK